VGRHRRAPYFGITAFSSPQLALYVFGQYVVISLLRVMSSHLTFRRRQFTYHQPYCLVVSGLHSSGYCGSAI